MTKKQSNVLKGIGILLIIFCHLKLPIPNISDHVFMFSGRMGVALFLFVTGYGFNKTYLERNKKFLPRFLKIYIPYFVVITFYYITNVFYFGKNIKVSTYIIHLLWLQSFFNVNAVIYIPIHFFSILLIAYLVTYMVTFLKKEVRFPILVFCIFLFNIYIVFFSKQNPTLLRFLIPLYAFLIGIVLSRNKFDSVTLILIMTSLVIIIYMPKYFVQFFVMIIITSIVIIAQQRIKKLKPLEYLGEKSYPLFLTHHFFLTTFKIPFQFNLRNYLGYFFMTFLWFYFVSESIVNQNYA